MGKYDELIEDGMSAVSFGLAGMASITSKTGAVRFIERAIQALRSEQDRFDVLEHLRNGGKVALKSDPLNRIMRLDYVGHLVDNRGDRWPIRELATRTWLPYDVPLEDGWYWCKGIDQPILYVDDEAVKYPSKEPYDWQENFKVLRNPDGTPMRIEEPGS